VLPISIEGKETLNWYESARKYAMHYVSMFAKTGEKPIAF